MELLVAIGVIALVFMAFAGVRSHFLGMNEKLRHRLSAHNAARNALSEIQSLHRATSDTETSLGPEHDEPSREQFDSVNDYHEFKMVPYRDLSGNSYENLGVQVQVRSGTIIGDSFQETPSGRFYRIRLLVIDSDGEEILRYVWLA